MPPHWQGPIPGRFFHSGVTGRVTVARDSPVTLARPFSDPVSVVTFGRPLCLRSAFLVLRGVLACSSTSARLVSSRPDVSWSFSEDPLGFLPGNL